MKLSALSLITLNLAGIALVTSSPSSSTGTSNPISIDVSQLGVTYEGIGALSGGGGVTRLLIDYPEPLQQDIYDILFKPMYGASLQYIKVEIGGDTQSTEGTESSHSHYLGDLNCSRGYEWNVLLEAKKRNPGMKTFGLSWGVPGYIGTYYSDLNTQYHLNWIQCSEEQYGIPIDFMGIWNERGIEPTWVKGLRVALDNAGYQNTRIVAGDTGWEIVGQMASDPELEAAIDIVGVHYPGTPPAQAYTLNRSLWASEMWNLGVVNDWNGAGALAHDLNQHALWGLSSSIIWCLIYSWFAILPFSTPTNTNAGGGHALLTAAEPWSGNYIINPTVPIVAHHTQFAFPGWTYLNINSTGMGNLPYGGTYVTVINTHVAAGVLEFSIIIQTMQGATQDQTVTFSLTGYGSSNLPTELYVWQTTEDAYFVQQPNVVVSSNGDFTVTIPNNAAVSITTTTGQHMPQPSNPVPPSAPFPFPYSDDFNAYLEGAYAKYFCDEGGVWIVQPIPSQYLDERTKHTNVTAPSGNAYYNVVTDIPIAWETNPSPYTLIGNFNGGANQSAWTDYTVSVMGMIDPSAAPSAPQYFADMQPCDSSNTAQQWIVQGGDSNGNITLPAYLENVAHPGYCLGVNGADPTTPGATAVGLANCSSTGSSTSGAQATQWQYNTNTDQLQCITNNQCIDVDAQNTSVGVAAVTWPCKSSNQDSNQLWNIVGTSTKGILTLQSQFENLCIDLNQRVPVANNPFLLVSSRIGTYERNGAPTQGYNFYLYPGKNSTANGSFTLAAGNKVLVNQALSYPITTGTWYSMAIIAQGTNITITLNNQVLTSVNDSTYKYGMTAIGSGWHHAWFDNFAIANNTQTV